MVLEMNQQHTQGQNLVSNVTVWKNVAYFQIWQPQQEHYNQWLKLRIAVDSKMIDCLLIRAGAKGQQWEALCPDIRVDAGAFKGPNELLINFISFSWERGSRWGAAWVEREGMEEQLNKQLEAESAACLTETRKTVDEDLHVLMNTVKACVCVCHILEKWIDISRNKSTLSLLWAGQPVVIVTSTIKWLFVLLLCSHIVLFLQIMKTDRPVKRNNRFLMTIISSQGPSLKLQQQTPNLITA